MFSKKGVNTDVTTNDKMVENLVMAIGSLVTGQNLGPWTHVQKRGRMRYGGGFGGRNDGRETASRYAVLADLEDDLTNEEKLRGEDHRAERDGQVMAGSTGVINAKIYNNKARKGKEINTGKNVNRSIINKRSNK